MRHDKSVAPEFTLDAGIETQGNSLPVMTAVCQHRMFHDNPYRATLLSKAQGARGRVVAVLWWLVYLHPVISLSLIYSCWTITTVSLGHPPGFGEHPDHDPAHTAVHILGIFAALSFLAGVVLIPAGLLWGLVQPFARLPPEKPTITSRLACLSTYVVIMVVVVFIWYSDPFGAIYWFWD